MTETESRPRNRALVASFLFTDLVGYSKGTASEQYAAKSALSDILTRNLAALNKHDYRIKDTGDGALIAFLSNPEHALYIALAIAHDFARAASVAGFPSNNVRTGLHIGAVKEAIDLESRPNFVGDGINAAQRIMDFAAPGQITASRAYFEAVSWLDSTYAALFQHLGASKDKHGRPHELYAIAPNDAVLERLRLDLANAALDTTEPNKPAVPAATEKSQRAAIATVSRSDASAKATGRRPWLVAAGALVTVILTASIAFIVMPRNPSGLTSQAVDGKASPLAPSVGAPALPAATAPPTGAPVQPAATALPATVPSAGAPSQPAATAASPAAETKVSSTPIKSDPGPASSGTPKADPASAARTTPDAIAAPTPPSRTAQQARPSAAAAVDPQRKAAEQPAAAAAVSAPSAGASVPAAAATARCRHILEKVQVGEPLSQDEKKELASSCR